jgi:hypothetical protein
MSEDRKIHKPNLLPDHERPLGRFMADVHGTVFRPLTSFAEAKTVQDGVVILQGDDGGQVYVACPVSLVSCSESTLEQLLVDLDELAWPGNDADMRRIYYERLAIGSGIPGGMGGGRITDEPWVHSNFIDRGLGPAISDVLRGVRPRIK